MVEVPEQLVREVQALLIAFAGGISTEEQRLDRAEQLHDELAKLLEASRTPQHRWLHHPFGCQLRRCIDCSEWEHSASPSCSGGSSP